MVEDAEKSAANLNLDDVIPGIEKFVIELEEEVKLHHSHIEWIDYDERCLEEQNLIVRVGIIIGMLDGVISQFDLPEHHDLAKRIKAAKRYFNDLNYM